MSPETSTGSAFSPACVLLGLLAQHPAHGYDLHQRLTADLGHLWRISLSQTYNILNRLEAQGLISGSVQEQAKRPARRRFRLTAAGRRRFEAWLHTPSGLSARAIRVEFTTRLYFAYARDPQLAQQLIEQQITETQAGLLRLQEKLADIRPEQTFNRLGLDLRIRQLKSILDWLDECRIALGASATERNP